jgi:hypothetical protein
MELEEALHRVYKTFMQNSMSPSLKCSGGGGGGVNSSNSSALAWFSQFHNLRPV